MTSIILFFLFFVSFNNFLFIFTITIIIFI